MNGHLFRADPTLHRDFIGRAYCADCGLPKINQVHVPPPDRPPEDVSDRIAGDGVNDIEGDTA